MNGASATMTVCMVLLLCGCGPQGMLQTTNIPRSHEASLIEVSSPCEWLVTATGIGDGHSEKNWDNLANQDARKAAVQFVVLGGTDPLIQTGPERQRFEYMKEDLFLPTTCQKFIAWEEMKYSNRVRFENPPQLRVTKKYKIDRCGLQEYLVALGVIEKARPEALGMPTIAVLPDIRPEQDAVEVMLSNPDLNHAATAIENHLTAHRFDVTVLRQKHEVDNIISQAKLLNDFIDDNECVIANAIGSDVYITFTLDVVPSHLANQELNKATVTVKAYETTTARLLGSETGYSETSTASIPALIESAINDAIGKVISRIEGYWKTDMERGIQYRLHVVFDQTLDRKWKDQASFVIRDGLRESCLYTKEIMASDNNLDYTVWVDLKTLPSLSDLYEKLRAYVHQHDGSADMAKVLLLRKMAVLSISRTSGGR